MTPSPSLKHHKSSNNKKRLRFHHLKTIPSQDGNFANVQFPSFHPVKKADNRRFQILSPLSSATPATSPSSPAGRHSSQSAASTRPPTKCVAPTGAGPSSAAGSGSTRAGAGPPSAAGGGSSGAGDGSGGGSNGAGVVRMEQEMVRTELEVVRAVVVQVEQEVV